MDKILSKTRIAFYPNKKWIEFYPQKWIEIYPKNWIENYPKKIENYPSHMTRAIKVGAELL